MATIYEENKEKPQVGKGYRVTSDRTEWVAYNNIEKMYDLVYEKMVDTATVINLHESEWYWIDKDSDQV